MAPTLDGINTAIYSIPHRDWIARPVTVQKLFSEIIIMFKSNRYLIIASTIGIVSIVCLMILYRQLALSSLVDHETRSNVALTEVLSNVIWSKYGGLFDTDTVKIRKTVEKHPTIQQLDAEVKLLMRGSNVVKVKIYNLKGLTVYSTDPSQINQDKSGNAGFLSAKAGKTASNITFRDQFDSFEGMQSNINVVSSYIPIGSRSLGESEAVFEIYSDVTELMHQIQRIQWQIFIGVLGSVAILYMLLITNSRRLDRIEAARLEEAFLNEAQIRYQASHDALTGLINRHEFERRAERLISTAQKHEAEHALCFMDLDQFKVINDTCGHIAGDELLRQLGHVLENTVRQSDTLARLGGDEFGVLLENCTQKQALRMATELQQTIQDFQFSWGERTFRIGVSIGLVAITETIPSLVELLQQADAACYVAKDLGRNRIHVFHPGDTEMSLRHGEMQWVARINHALEENRFILYAQNIVPLDKGTDMQYELLLRMIDKQGNIIPPGAFLSAAERYDLMDKLDAWTIENAFKLMASHPVFVEQIHFITINLSGQSLTKVKFLNSLIARIKESKINPSKICFEITETAAISNFKAATTFIPKLRELGCHFALDNFGSGLSSFGYLKNLQVDYLKIDGMFVKDIVDDPIDHAMVKSINDIGHVMGMKTIGEFVENDDIKDMLRMIGVDYAQGYGIGRPQPFDEIVGIQKKLRAS
jgi:diguanylate cyclase (GGDEF)-like protein